MAEVTEEARPADVKEEPYEEKVASTPTNYDEQTGAFSSLTTGYADAAEMSRELE
jgi:hypothetical protein